jgi:hypothetical protein
VFRIRINLIRIQIHPKDESESQFTVCYPWVKHRKTIFTEPNHFCGAGSISHRHPEYQWYRYGTWYQRISKQDTGTGCRYAVAAILYPYTVNCVQGTILSTEWNLSKREPVFWSEKKDYEIPHEIKGRSSTTKTIPWSFLKNFVVGLFLLNTFKYSGVSPCKLFLNFYINLVVSIVNVLGCEELINKL